MNTVDFIRWDGHNLHYSGATQGTNATDDAGVEWRCTGKGWIRGPTLATAANPEHAAVLPVAHGARKAIPMATGLLDYFPDALAEVAKVSKIGNDKHNPGEPMHWSREKSNDHADCIIRHMVDRGTVDPETGILHDAQVAWRALAMLQLALEKLNKTS
jgi:hypothetical protein